MNTLIPNSVYSWYLNSNISESPKSLDIILITHPRDESDLKRLFPWSANLSGIENNILIKCLKPVFGEIINTENYSVGFLFLPFYANDITSPRSTAICRSILKEGIETCIAYGAKVICLGGLTASLSKYGKKVESIIPVDTVLTTGHCMTTISVYLTLIKAIKDFELLTDSLDLTIIGMGSIGSSFIRLFLYKNKHKFKKITFVDRPSRLDDLMSLKKNLEADFDCDIDVAFTESNGSLSRDNKVYFSDIVVSAVSSAYIIDIERVAPGTILIDDSQPYCWSREDAWERCRTELDIVPCEAGLINCAAIGFNSWFPFDFADYNSKSGSSISWSCLAEGLVKFKQANLTNTIGEPKIQHIIDYYEAFEELNLSIPSLQCGEKELPIQELKERFKKLK